MASSPKYVRSRNATDRGTLAQIYQLPQQIRNLHISTASDAAAKVFSSPELLEKILAYLPFMDLFVTMRANRAFRNMITSSIKLYKCLFIVPRSSLQLDKGGTLCTNPFLDHAFKGLGFELAWKHYKEKPFHVKFVRFQEVHEKMLTELSKLENPGSWRLTRITDVSVVTKICIENRIPFQMEAEVFDVELEGQSATLGKLWDIALHLRKHAIMKYEKRYGRLYDL